jgi:Ca2+-binding RTX toxin-like protein
MTAFGVISAVNGWLVDEDGNRIARDMTATATVQPMSTVDYTVNMLVGGNGSEVLNVTTTKYIVFGMGGNDTLNGSTGSDLLVGDYFSTSYLNAILNGQDPAPPGYDSSMIGNDSLSGGAGDDILFADLGNDILKSGDGNDALIVFVSNFGTDTLYGGSGSDTIYFEDDFQLGFDTFVTNSLLLNAAASIEVLDIGAFSSRAQTAMTCSTSVG